MRWFIIFFVICLVSCSVFKPGYHRSVFSYRVQGRESKLPLILPSGFTSSKFSSDSAGNQGWLYHYGGGRFYIVFVSDSTEETMVIDTASHIPRQIAAGGRVYKGMDANGLFWREIRFPYLRLGYQFIPRSLETVFDSATNYAALRFIEQQR